MSKEKPELGDVWILAGLNDKIRSVIIEVKTNVNGTTVIVLDSDFKMIEYDLNKFLDLYNYVGPMEYEYKILFAVQGEMPWVMGI